MKILENIEKYLLYLVVFILPLAVLPVFPNYFETIKLAVLAGTVVLILVLKSIRSISTGSLSYATGNFDLPVVGLASAVLLSAILKTPNKMEAFFLPGNATIIIASVLLYFLINHLPEHNKKNLLLVLITSAAATALVSLFSFFGVFSKIPQLPEIFKQKLFNTLGSPLYVAIFLGATVPSAIYFLIKEKAVALKMYLAGCLTLILVGLGILIYNLVPPAGQMPIFADLSSSWAVAIDTLKESPLLGVGPSNYLTAFNRFRPLSLNASPNWNLRFTTGSNFYFTILTEVGLLGFAFLIVIVFWLVKNRREFMENLAFPSLVTLLIALAVFPPGSFLIVLMFALLALNSKARRETLGFFSNKLPLFLATMPTIAGSIFLIYYSYILLSAEATFNKSLNALNKNDGKATYDLMVKAISQNPSVDRYHASFAQVNMALARAAAQKKDLTDADRNTISQLIQQAINQGKAAAALNPQRSQNWEILAGIYREIMAFAKGADAFTVQTYSQAISLDPTNPNLRIALGGVYYALGNYDDAIDAFKLATFAKPDLANAHYNLAIAYREKKDIERAIAEMKVVLTLVQKDSADYKLAQTTLEELEKNKPAPKVSEGQGSLTPPQATEPAVEPPLTLPQEATPPSSVNQ